MPRMMLVFVHRASKYRIWGHHSTSLSSSIYCHCVVSNISLDESPVCRRHLGSKALSWQFGQGGRATCPDVVHEDLVACSATIPARMEAVAGHRVLNKMAMSFSLLSMRLILKSSLLLPTLNSTYLIIEKMPNKSLQQTQVRPSLLINAMNLVQYLSVKLSCIHSTRPSLFHGLMIGLAFASSMIYAYEDERISKLFDFGYIASS